MMGLWFGIVPLEWVLGIGIMVKGRNRRDMLPGFVGLQPILQLGVCHWAVEQKTALQGMAEKMISS